VLSRKTSATPGAARREDGDPQYRTLPTVFILVAGTTDSMTKSKAAQKTELNGGNSENAFKKNEFKRRKYEKCSYGAEGLTGEVNPKKTENFSNNKN